MRLSHSRHQHSLFRT